MPNIHLQSDNQPDTSDIDTDSFENESNRVEYNAKIKKKLTKARKKKLFSTKFFDILTLSLSDNTLDLDENVMEEIIQIIHDQTKND